MNRRDFLPTYHFEDTESNEIKDLAEDKLRDYIITGNHGKNLIPFPYVSKVGTQNGVEITIDDNGVITLNGTATAAIYFGLLSPVNSPEITKPGKYTISGMPGAVSGVSIQCYVDDTWESRYRDTGNGGTFTVTSSIKYVTMQINSGSVCDNVVIKPMLEESETKTDFEPWCGVGDRTRNLIPYPYTDTTKTMNGITFTDNGDGSVTVNGTATGDGASFVTVLNSSGFVGQGTYYLSGCPSNSGQRVSLQSKVDDKWDNNNYDFGSGKVISVQSKLTNISCVMGAGTTVENLTFKPMLIDLDAQNLIPYPYARTTQTISGVTLTDNGDGSITVNGTATANVWYPISTRSASTIYATKGKYYLSGCPSGGSGNTYWLQCDVYNGTTQRAGFYDVGKGKTQDLSAYDITTLSINIHVNSGTTVNNLTFRPLLVNMDSISGYEPYGYKIELLNKPWNNLLNVDDCEIPQTNGYYAEKNITLTDSSRSLFLPYAEEMKGKNVTYSCDIDNNNFKKELICFYDEKDESGSNKSITIKERGTFPTGNIVRLAIRARSENAEYNNVNVKISNITLKYEDVEEEKQDIYLKNQIMDDKEASYKTDLLNDIILHKDMINDLSINSKVKPKKVSYSYYTYKYPSKNN